MENDERSGFHRTVRRSAVTLIRQGPDGDGGRRARGVTDWEKRRWEAQRARARRERGESAQMSVTAEGENESFGFRFDQQGKDARLYAPAAIIFVVTHFFLPS